MIRLGMLGGAPGGVFSNRLNTRIDQRLLSCSTTSSCRLSTATKLYVGYVSRIVRTGGLLMSAISPELCEPAYADALPIMRLSAIALALRDARRRLSGGTAAAALATSSDAHSSFSGNCWTDTNRGDTVVEVHGQFAGRSKNKQMAIMELITAVGMILRISPL